MSRMTDYKYENLESKEKPERQAVFSLGAFELAGFGSLPNDASARGCVMRTEPIIHIIHTLGWGLSPGGSRGYLKTSGKPARGLVLATLSFSNAPKVTPALLRGLQEVSFWVKCHHAQSGRWSHTALGGGVCSETLRDSSPFSPKPRGPAPTPFLPFPTSASPASSPFPASSLPGLQKAARWDRRQRGGRNWEATAVL